MATRNSHVCDVVDIVCSSGRGHNEYLMHSSLGGVISVKFFRASRQFSRKILCPYPRRYMK